MKNHLQKHVPKFLSQISHILVVYRLNRLVGFFYHALSEGLVGLNSVPWALAPENRNDFRESLNRLFAVFSRIGQVQIFFSYRHFLTYFINLSRIFTSLSPFGSLASSSFVIAFSTKTRTT